MCIFYLVITWCKLAVIGYSVEKNAVGCTGCGKWCEIQNNNNRNGLEMYKSVPFYWQDTF